MSRSENNSIQEKLVALKEDILELKSVDVETKYNEVSLEIKRRQRVSRNEFIMKTAAILSLPLFLLSTVLGYLYYDNSFNNKELFSEVVAQKGTFVKYQLPDNSTVWLNSGSKLRFPTKFNKKSRSVYLEGEAYFDVQADKDCPFYVHMKDGLKTYVYGTKFNIQSYSNSEDISILLQTGHLNVILPENNDEIVMSPGDEVLYNNSTGNYSKKKVDVDIKTAWTKGKLIFRNAGLDEIFKMLEKHFNVKIVYNNHNGKDYRYRATFCNESLVQILEYMAKSTKMEWTMDYVSDGELDDNPIKMIQIEVY